MSEPQPNITGNRSKRFRSSLIPITIAVMAIGLIVLITGNWTAWHGARVVQTTDDAYVRADLTPLSTKVAGLVASVEVADYQAVKAGDLLVRLQDADFRAQVEQAEAELQSAGYTEIESQTLDPSQRTPAMRTIMTSGDWCSMASSSSTRTAIP